MRPDSGYSLPVLDAAGERIGEVGHGNRKDIRNAVEAAHKAAGWARTTAHQRAQVLYYIAENLAAREFAGARTSTSAADGGGARHRPHLHLGRVGGQVRRPRSTTPYRNVTLAMPEPIGVMGIVCPDAAPLLGLVSTVSPAIAMGNTVIVVPSATAPLAAIDFYQVLDTSDLPGGVVNIVTGPRRS